MVHDKMLWDLLHQIIDLTKKNLYLEFGFVSLLIQTVMCLFGQDHGMLLRKVVQAI